jgi:hypothetical protein
MKVFMCAKAFSSPAQIVKVFPLPSSSLKMHALIDKDYRYLANERSSVRARFLKIRCASLTLLS